MSGHGAKSRKAARKFAIRQDVRIRASYAFLSQDHSNPYSPDDKRFVMFAKELSRSLQIDHDFRDIHVAMGGSLEDLVLKDPVMPDPVVPLDQFGQPENLVKYLADTHFVYLFETA